MFLNYRATGNETDFRTPLKTFTEEQILKGTTKHSEETNYS